jgi:hypothetical protein
MTISSIGPSSTLLGTLSSSPPKQDPVIPIPIRPITAYYDHLKINPNKKRKFEKLYKASNSLMTVFGAAIKGRFRYVGLWRDNQIHYGKIFDMQKAGRLVYQGLFQDNQPHGNNIIWEKEDGSVYIGNCDRGCFPGTMAMLFGSSRFVGAATSTGLAGLLTSHGHPYYAGELKDGKFHGLGSFLYSSGDRYEGEYSHGKREGTGTYYMDEGVILEGTWKEDKKEGTFSVTGASMKLFCTFKEDRLEGPCMQELPNGDIAYGCWENEQLVKAAVFKRQEMAGLSYRNEVW